MLQEYEDFTHAGEDDSIKPIVPDADNEFVRAKTFLQTGSTLTGDNLYDHLTDVLNKILAERPENVIDFFEEYSRKVKEKRFKPLTDHLEDIYVHPPRYKLCKKWQPLLLPLQPDAPSTMDPEDMEIADMTQNNMLMLLYYFEQAGVGLPRNEMFAIMMSMMRFVKIEPVSSVRFWGKVYGDYKNYLVLETELNDEEIIRRHEANQTKIQEEMRIEEEAEAAAKAAEEQMAKISQEIQGEEHDSPADGTRPLPPLPVSHFEELPEIPEEPPGVGVNKKVYYVCNEAGDEWIQLPDVTPQQIKAARLVKKSITGNLGQSICTYPEFPGNETNYLRAQIARISAGSQISPLGYYTFSEEEGEGAEETEEEEDEEEEDRPKGGQHKTAFHENLRFEGNPIRDMMDPSMAFWVHHAQYILPQGRTTWWNPSPGDELPGEGEGEGMGGEGMDEEEEDRPLGNRVEPETGPPLLTALSEDSSLDAVAPWSVRCSSQINPQFAVVVVRSNIWPGAFCFSTQRKLFDNIYLGDGMKYMSHNFSPKPLTAVQQDYPIGPEVMEMEDPTGKDEEDWRIAHLPKEPPTNDEEEEAAEEEEEEEEEEDEDDDD